MKEERMKILSMLEDGKITADEAAKIMESISQMKDNVKTGFKTDFKKIDNGEWQSVLEEKIKTFSKAFDDLGKEIGKRLDSASKDVEPKLKNAAQTLVKKTNETVEELSQVFKSGQSKCCSDETCDCAEAVSDCVEKAEGCVDEACGCSSDADNGPRPEENKEV